MYKPRFPDGGKAYVGHSDRSCTKGCKDIFCLLEIITLPQNSHNAWYNVAAILFDKMQIF